MNRQTKNIRLQNNFGRSEYSKINVKNNLKGHKSESTGNHTKTINRLTKSSISLESNSTKQRTTTSNKGNYPKNTQETIKTTSSINLISYAPKTEYENKIPEKKIYTLRDIRRKDFQLEFSRQNRKFDTGNEIKPASKVEIKDLNQISEKETKAEENKNENFVSHGLSTMHLEPDFSRAREEIIKNVTKKINFLEEVLNENDINKKKNTVINFFKKNRENSMKHKRLHGETRNQKPINKEDQLIPITPELMQSLNLQVSDISLLLKILQHKPQEKDNEPPQIKFSSEPFVKLRKLNNTNIECSVKNTCDISTRFTTQNTNVIKESDCFISKVQEHFIDRSLYQRERKPVTVVPTLSTITEEHTSASY